MAYNIICNSTFTVQSSVGNIPLSIAISVPLSGSNLTWKSQDIVTTSWQPLDTGSLSDVRYLAANNIGTGSIQLATDSAGTKIISMLMQKNDAAIIPWSASVASSTFYARAYTSASTLAYLITES